MDKTNGVNGKYIGAASSRTERNGNSNKVIINKNTYSAISEATKLNQKVDEYINNRKIEKVLLIVTIGAAALAALGCAGFAVNLVGRLALDWSPTLFLVLLPITTLAMGSGCGSSLIASSFYQSLDQKNPYDNISSTIKGIQTEEQWNAFIDGVKPSNEAKCLLENIRRISV